MANDRLRTSITIHCSRRDIETEINYYSQNDSEAYFSLQLGATGRLSDVDIYLSKEQMLELMNAISAALQDADIETNDQKVNAEIAQQTKVAAIGIAQREIDSLREEWRNETDTDRISEIEREINRLIKDRNERDAS